jgi:hypothetical protein
MCWDNVCIDGILDITEPGAFPRQRDGAGDLLPVQRDEKVTQLADLAKTFQEAEADQKKAKLDLDFREGRMTQEEYRQQLAQMPLRADQCSAPLEQRMATTSFLNEAI